MKAPKGPGTDYEVKTDRVGPWWRRRWTLTLSVNATGYRTQEEAAADALRVASAAVREATERPARAGHRRASSISRSDLELMA